MDEQLLVFAAAAEQMHVHLLRPFLRKAKVDGHKVLINHKNGKECSGWDAML
jgi:hypothetical protein